MTKIEALNLIWEVMLKRPNLDMTKQFNRIYKVTNNSKLRSFQFRLLHNAIVFNNKLKISKIKESEYCSNCQLGVEDALHFFVECEHAQILWHQVQKLLETQYHIQDIVIDNHGILFNQIVTQDCHVANFLVLITKYHMYAARCKGEKLNINVIRNLLKKYEILELYNAKRNNKVVKHLRKWNPEQCHVNTEQSINKFKYIE